MSDTIFIESLSHSFWLNKQIIISRFNQWYFQDLNSWIKFFEENIEIIKAQPFIKRVGWKRQLIKQFEILFPQEFNNYFEPFLWWWAVFFNLQREKSFLSDVNEELINTYQVIKDKPIVLLDFLKTINHSKENFLEMRIAR